MNEMAHQFFYFIHSTLYICNAYSKESTKKIAFYLFELIFFNI